MLFALLRFFGFQWYAFLLYLSSIIPLIFYNNLYLPEVSLYAKSNYYFLYYLLLLLFVVPFYSGNRSQFYLAPKLSAYLKVALLLLLSLQIFLQLYVLLDQGVGLFSARYEKFQVNRKILFLGPLNLLVVIPGVYVLVYEYIYLGRLKWGVIFIASNVFSYILQGHSFGAYLAMCWVLSYGFLSCKTGYYIIRNNAKKIFFGLMLLIFSLVGVKFYSYIEKPPLEAASSISGLGMRFLAQGQLPYLEYSKSDAVDQPTSVEKLFNYIEVISLEVGGWNARFSLENRGTRLSAGFPANMVSNFGYLGAAVVLLYLGAGYWLLVKLIVPETVGVFTYSLTALSAFSAFEFLTQGQLRFLILSYFVLILVKLICLCRLNRY